METRRFRIMIAGGGIAALEATLALREALGEVRPTVIAPSGEFVTRQLSLSEPFGTGSATRLPLSSLIEAAGAEHLPVRLRAVRPEEQLVVTESAELDYDALLLATGARPIRALAGAFTYVPGPGERELNRLIVEALTGSVRSIAFAVPPSIGWALPAYELALMMAAALRHSGRTDVELSLVTHEPAPLAALGEGAGCAIRDMLARAGVALRTSSAPLAVREGSLSAGDSEIEADRVVSLPRLVVPPIPGIPQGAFGFIPTDSYMQVQGLFRVWAAGDATSYPVKQGGLAAQQADAAASAIASCLDPSIDRVPFRPVLRAVLLTGDAPCYMRADLDRGETAISSGAPLWWPPAKVAGRLLSPFIAARVSGRKDLPAALEDLPASGDLEAGARNGRAYRLALRAADVYEAAADYPGAAHWLGIAEQLRLSLPPQYARRREEWLAR